MDNSVIEVSVNNEQQQFALDSSVSEMLRSCGFDAKKVAVAINTEFVPRSSYETHQIQDGDAVDVLAAVQGG